MHCHHLQLLERATKRLPASADNGAPDPMSQQSPSWHLLNPHLPWILPSLLQLVLNLHHLSSPQVADVPQRLNLLLSKIVHVKGLPAWLLAFAFSSTIRCVHLQKIMFEQPCGTMLSFWYLGTAAILIESIPTLLIESGCRVRVCSRGLLQPCRWGLGRGQSTCAGCRTWGIGRTRASRKRRRPRSPATTSPPCVLGSDR